MSISIENSEEGMPDVVYGGAGKIGVSKLVGAIQVSLPYVWEGRDGLWATFCNSRGSNCPLCVEKGFAKKFGCQIPDIK